MKVTLTAFRCCGNDANGVPIPVGKDKISSQLLIADGAFTVIDNDATFIRVATDTAIHMNVKGGATTNADELIPAGVEFFFCNGGEIFNILTA